MKTFLRILFFFLLVTQICFAQWVQTNDPFAGSVRALAVSGTNLFAGTYFFPPTTTYGGVFLSTNNGTSWTEVNTGLTNINVYAFAVSGTNLFAGTSGGVFLSTNNGTSWTEVNTGLTYPVAYALAVSGTNLFAGTYVGVFLSTNNGTSWTEVNTGLPKSAYDTTQYVRVGCFTVSGTNLFAGAIDAGAIDGGVFLSTNNGTSWTEVNTGLTYPVAYALAVSGTNLFAGTSGGVFLSTNNGTSWTAVNTGLTNTYVWAFAVSGTNLFAGTSGGVFLSTNNGTSWTEVNAGLTNTSVWAFAVSGTNLFAGTSGGGVWRRQLSEMITDVEELNPLPTEFSLGQNYPNPLNPSTKIKYSIPKSSQVSLKIFNTLGEEIETLVNEEKPVGTYELNWNASNLPSGVYFYRIQTGDFVQTRKMILLK
jgi:hypothetical protein